MNELHSHKDLCNSELDGRSPLESRLPFNNNRDPWGSYRLRSLSLWACVAFLPVLGCLTASFSEAFSGLLFLVNLLLIGIVGTWRMRFPCPQCGKPFFRSTAMILGSNIPYRNFFADRCLNCGLPKWCNTMTDIIIDDKEEGEKR